MHNIGTNSEQQDLPTASPDITLRRDVVTILGKGSARSLDSLLSLHDKLARSLDPYFQIAAGWAALYASQKQTASTMTDDYFDLAQERWKQATTFEESEFHEDPGILNLQAKLYLCIAPQIRHERNRWTKDERRSIAGRIGTVATECAQRDVGRDANARGLLAEITCLQLLWRDSPLTPMLNSVPAGPGKDGRIGTTKFNTDAYAYMPGTSPTQKGVNIQIKSTLRPDQLNKYDPSAIVLVIAGSHFSHPKANNARPGQKIVYTSKGCAEELNESEVDIERRIHLDKSSATVHNIVMSSMRARHPHIVQRPKLPPKLLR